MTAVAAVMTAEWLLWCSEAWGRNLLSPFTLQYVELIYFALQGCVEFASKYLLENEISQQKNNSKFLLGHVHIIHLL